MEQFGEGAGLAAFGFWFFIAAIVVGGIWDKIKKRDAQHETLRRIVESGQPVDDSMANRILAASADSQQQARDLKVGAYICAGLAPGLACLGYAMSFLAEELLVILLGVSGLVLFISLSMYLAARFIDRNYTA